MYTHNNKVLQNLYFLPFLMVFFQFVFLFISLIFSGYFFEWKILFSAFFIVCVWGSLFLISALKNKNINFNIQNIILFIIFSICCLCLIRFSWFSHYLRIDAVKRFFEGKTFIDTLYHSAIAESIVTNGYPSIQQNAPIFLAYHCLSHYIVAGFSRVLNIPCFITYNYLFPLIFIPLFLFLLQKVVSIGKQYFSDNSSLSLFDFVILVGFVLGFFTKKIQTNIGCNLTVNIYNSESCLTSIVISLLYFCFMNRGYRNIKKFDNINLFVFVPIMIILLSYSKISFGCIFALGNSYYVFRKYFFKNKKLFLAAGYLMIFILYYFMMRKISISTNYSAPILMSRRGFQLFYYPRVFCKNYLYMFFHYLFLFFPIIVVAYRQKETIFKKIITYNNECILVEMCFLLMLVACLPGCFLVIHGGAAFYFVIPVYIFSWILFISSNSKQVFDEKIFLIKNKIIIECNIFMFIVGLIIFSSCFNDMHLRNSLIQTFRSRISTVGFKKNIPQKVEELFNLPTQIQFRKEYVIMNQVKKRIKQSPIDYCVFLSDNTDFANNYDNYLLLGHPQNYYIRPYLAISAYLGLPVINSVYERNGYFYRGDGKIFGDYNQISGYSLPPALCDKKITKDNMVERAKMLGKKFVIVIENNYYSIVNVN